MSWTEQDYARVQELGLQTTDELVKVCDKAKERAEAAGTPPLVIAYGLLSGLERVLVSQAVVIARTQQTASLPGDAELFAQFQRAITDAVLRVLGLDPPWPESKKPGRA